MKHDKASRRLARRGPQPERKVSTMTMTNSTRSGTLHLPCFKKDAAPVKPVPIPKPINVDRGVVETRADVSASLAPEHRKGPRIKGALNELAASLVALTADVAPEPRDTRSLRLTLAVIALAPECPPALVTYALKTYAADAPEPDRLAAEELRRAVFGSINSARLARFKAMIESAITVIDERRVEAPSEQTKEGSEHAT